jgi:hypothetical protein
MKIKTHLKAGSGSGLTDDDFCRSRTNRAFNDGYEYGRSTCRGAH